MSDASARVKFRQPFAFISERALLPIAGALFVLGALIPADIQTEAYLAATVGVAILVLNHRAEGGLRRLAVLVLCLLLTLRYFEWRVTETFAYYDPLSLVGSVCLFGAEIYGLLMMLLGLFANLVPITRAVDPAPLDATAPRVDVLVPSYNESVELLAVTLCAATQITYPAGRIEVHLLDDGGTDQKCADSDPRRAAAAQARRVALQQLCARFGATYRTRARNTHAKAGNINHALPHLAGDLVLILDADHVPTADILVRTVPLFRGADDLFLVQTPHFFMNPDTVEKNLDLFLKMPGENEMFHRAIQSGLDYWNSSIFCGSAAVLRRSCLLEVGGIATGTITEDAETALALHARGYRSAYVARPMVAGLAPETFTGMVTQRVRWAQGMLQILLLKSPVRMAGLSPAQRLGYLSCTLYWMFPFARLVFLAAPIAYLVFDLKIYAANASGVLVFAVPHMVASFIATARLFGRYRWPLVSHVYETLLGLLMLRPLWSTLRQPNAPSFQVTPKGEHLDDDFVSPLVRPFYVVFAVIALTLPVGLWRVWSDAEHRTLVLITLVFELFNLMVMLGALGALFERRQRRTVPRLHADMPAALLQGGRRFEGRVTDLSMGGARFETPSALPDLGASGPIALEVTAPHLPAPVALHVHLRTQHGGACGIAFTSEDAQFRATVMLVHGDSGRWSGFWSSGARQTEPLRAFSLLLRTGMGALGLHAIYVGEHAAAVLAAHLPRRRPIAKGARHVVEHPV